MPNFSQLFKLQKRALNVLTCPKDQKQKGNLQMDQTGKPKGEKVGVGQGRIINTPEWGLPIPVTPSHPNKAPLLKVLGGVVFLGGPHP